MIVIAGVRIVGLVDGSNMSLMLRMSMILGCLFKPINVLHMLESSDPADGIYRHKFCVAVKNKDDRTIFRDAWFLDPP